MGKKSVLDNLIYQFKPDIVGTEAWLKPTIFTNETFSSCFEVFRRDRPDGYGGVFLACSKDFCWQSIPIKSSCDAEVVAFKLELKNSLLIVIGVYRPPNSDLIYLQSLCQTIEDIIKENPVTTIWLGGDINLPNIDWSTNSPSGNNYPTSFCNLVLNLFYDMNFTQLVTFPTRNENTLDSFATNRPTLVRVYPFTGLDYWTELFSFFGQVSVFILIGSLHFWQSTRTLLLWMIVI